MNFALSFTELIPSFIQGIQITLFYWFITLILALLLMIPATSLRLSKNPLISYLMRIYIYLMRGTPLMLQLMFVFFGLPYIGITFSRTTAAIIALVLNYTAYFVEILRGGIQSIDEGQIEAAQMLGFSKRYIYLKILLPQALRNCIPSFMNECLTLLKDTCLVSILGIDELLRYAKIAVNRQANVLPFVYAALIYLLLNLPITKGLNMIEKKLNYYK